MQLLSGMHSKNTLVLLILCLLSAVLITACGGSSGSSAADVAKLFNRRDVNLYSEVPAIEVQGNSILRDNPAEPADIPYTEVRNFNPQTMKYAELYDSDNDGVEDTMINDFESFCNAANRLIDINLAACAGMYPDNHLGYDPTNTGVWVDAWRGVPGTEIQGSTPLKYEKYKYQYPDTMPATASGAGSTNSTQFIQLIFPFDIDRATLFDKSLPNASDDDYLNPDFLTIVNEDGDHVYATVLVNGVDVDGVGPEVYTADPQWQQLIDTGINIKPPAGSSSIVFIAQSSAGVLGSVPNVTPFNVWSTHNEIRIHLKKAYDVFGQLIDVNSKWCVLKEGGTPQPPEVVSTGITATDPVKDASGSDVMDPMGPYMLINRETGFIIEFDKPVIPETVGQSIVFNGAPFNGNTSTLPSNLVGQTLDPNPCANSGSNIDPIGTNVSIVAELIFDGNTSTNSGTQAVIPFRCHPLHQNNLSTYVLNPTIDLPGAEDLGVPLFSNPTANRIRVTVNVYHHDSNDISGQFNIASPIVNMGPCGFFGGVQAPTPPPPPPPPGPMFAPVSQSFSVTSGGRYVNAPVSPHALYYAMGPKGLGVVDLDGNGFTTNNPDFSRVALVTSVFWYSPFGNSGKGNGNDYSYAAKAVQGSGVTSIGLGYNTPMPGVNECSAGIDEVVRDSNGSAQLFPDPTDADVSGYIVNDVEIGDFLDAIYFDSGNVWTHKSYHLSAINTAAIGNYVNNLISTPPTPNPPPMTLPIGMRATHVILDEFDLSDEGAFVIMGKEVFTVDMVSEGIVAQPPSLLPPWNCHTGFIHLEPAELAGSPVDENYPPNPNAWVASTPNYMNLGPVAESCTSGVGWYYGSRQQIGNFLFVADKANNAVRVLNSNNMELITSLSDGLSQPDSVTVTPDLARLYVSSGGNNTVMVYDVNPLSENFLYPVATVLVGAQPRGVCVQPDNEDVFVCNYGSSTISIINPKTNTVRKTLSSLLKKPWDCVMGPRQGGFGFLTGVFHGYISNYGGNNVLVYESGPDGIGGIGYDDILDPVPEQGAGGEPFSPIYLPRGICWDPLFYEVALLTGGCFVAHSSGAHAMVSRIQFTAQQAPYGVIFLIPNAGSIGGTPGFGKRVFEITSQWGGPDSPLSGTAATDVAFMDYNRSSWENETWGATFYVTNIGDLGQNPISTLPVNNKHPIRILPGPVYQPVVDPDRLFVSFQFTPVIDILNPISSKVVKTVTGLPAGAKILKTYFKN